VDCVVGLRVGGTEWTSVFCRVQHSATTFPFSLVPGTARSTPCTFSVLPAPQAIAEVNFEYNRVMGFAWRAASEVPGCYPKGTGSVQPPPSR
jgi:hypothetical protein